MPRANRHYIPGQVWHITHRCHKREFLLNFPKDRKRYIHWLFEAKKRYGLCVLNYSVTSNHVHLLAIDTGQNVIPQSIQLIAGRVAQEFNQRKGRKGAFWEDRYHATAVASDEHLIRCLTYIDLNMVRAGAVEHPSQWEMCGFNEIQNPRTRYSIIDHQGLRGLCGFSDAEEFKKSHILLVEGLLDNGRRQRESCWTESVAVGSTPFVEEIRAKLGFRARGRNVELRDDLLVLREETAPYSPAFAPEKGVLRPENGYIWDESYIDSIT